MIPIFSCGSLLYFLIASKQSKQPSEAENHKESVALIKSIQEKHFDSFSKLLAPYQYGVFCDLPEHDNKGDVAITISEFIITKKLNIEIVGYCFYKSCTGADVSAIRKMIDEKNYDISKIIILLHGGGNLFAWPKMDGIRMRIFSIFKGFQFLLLPQSISIPQRSLETGEADKITQRYQKQTNLTMLMRDQTSFMKANELQLVPREKIFLVPDSAFQLGPMPITLSPTYDILWLRRGDSEKITYEIPEVPEYVSFRAEDWIHFTNSPGTTAWENCQLKIQKGFDFLQRGRVLITDRLHGHILSTMLNIPHVIFDTKYRKLRNFHETWTRGMSNIESAGSAEEALKKALILLEKYNNSRAKIIETLA